MASSPTHSCPARARNGPSAWNEIAARLQSDPLLDHGSDEKQTTGAVRDVVELCPALLKQITEALRLVVQEELRRPLVDGLPLPPLPTPGQHGAPLPAGPGSESEPRASVGQLMVTAFHDAVKKQGPSEGASPELAKSKWPAQPEPVAPEEPVFFVPEDDSDGYHDDLLLEDLEFKVVIDKTSGRRLGASGKLRGDTLEIVEVVGELFQQWNDDHPDLAVKRGDRIAEVNGMKEWWTQNHVLELVVKRRKLTEDAQLALTDKDIQANGSSSAKLCGEERDQDSRTVQWDPSAVVVHSEPDLGAGRAIMLAPTDLTWTPTEDEDIEANGNQTSLWEWEGSNGKGWISYTTEQSERLEEGWRSGVSRMLLRSGVSGNVPIEVYFVDMVQVNPESERKRRIRRVGEKPLRTRATRQWRAVLHNIETGEPIWETLAQYKERQLSMEVTTKPRLRPGSSHMHDDRQWLRRLVEDLSASYMFPFSIVVTVCWCVYLGIDTQRYPIGMSVYRKDETSIALELSFSCFFLVELVMRMAACRSARHFARNAWNLIDTLCVLGSFLDVLFVPAVTLLVPGTLPQNTESNLNVLRTCRLFKLIRILRLCRLSLDVEIFVKGLMSGVKESAIVWGMITSLVYVFSILLRTYATDEVREKVFPSLGLTVHRLIVTGILLDDVGHILDLMDQSADWCGYVMFLAFVFCSQYVLLNMLIGFIASVAIDVRTEEKARANTLYLRKRLENVVQCFMEDDGLISITEFDLITRNADVHKVLQHFGAEMKQLASMRESLYAEDDNITFDKLLEAVGQMNEGKIATVRDIFHAQEEVKRALHSVEVQLDPSHRRRSKSK